MRPLREAATMRQHARMCAILSGGAGGSENGLFRPKICELGITRVCAAPVTSNVLEDGMGSVKNAIKK